MIIKKTDYLYIINNKHIKNEWMNEKYINLINSFDLDFILKYRLRIILRL